MRKTIILALLVFWVATVAGTIFWFSSQTGSESGEASRGLMEILFSFLDLNEENKETLHLLVRKGAHMTEYAVLGASVCVLLYYLADMGYLRNACAMGMAGGALALSSLFAVTDEIHQAFVPGRGPAVRDVLIDAVGAAIGITAVYLIYRHKRRSHNHRS